MFDGYEKEKPCAYGEKVENHAPYRYIQYFANEAESSGTKSEQLVFSPIYIKERVEEKVQCGCRFCQNGSKCSSGNTHFGCTEVPEYKNVVEYDIGDSHDDCIYHQYFGAGDSYEKGPEHHTDRSEQEPEYPILHVIFSGLTYGSGGDEAFQHLWGPYKRREDENY